MLDDLGKKQFIPVSRALIVAFLLLLIVLVGNGVTGFTTSLVRLQEAAANATNSKILVENLEKQATECSVTLNSTSDLFNSCRNDLEIKRIENSKLASETYIYERNLTTYANRVEVLQREVEGLKGLSESLAVNICCLRRYVLEDDSLAYYYIKDNKTFCTSAPDDILQTKGFSC
ncbi:MAG: hypothetical protein HYS53_03145 [Candidatus Aenigmarchaeota archaeon]|nr:hypothetical protein [Candidatus Aenigmarchaeota archaeon]